MLGQRFRFERVEAERKANGEEFAWPEPTSSRRSAPQMPNSESERKGQEETEKMMSEPLEHDLATFREPSSPPTTVYTGNWKREQEYEDLQRELREATKRDLNIHPYKHKPLSNSQDFLSEPGAARQQLACDDTEPYNPPEAGNSEFLADLPPHTVVDGFGELGVYMSQASYVISLGGSALPDLKYGIIIVPAGDESLLFTGYGDHADMPADFRAEIYAKSREVRKQVFDEEIKMCGSYVPRTTRRGGHMFRLPPMEEPEKLFYAQRVRESRAKHRELHGTRRSSDVGSQLSDGAEAEAGAVSFSDQYPVRSPGSNSSQMYIHGDSIALPPIAGVVDGLRRLFAQQLQQQEKPGGGPGHELYHPDKLNELAQFLWKLADGNVLENPGLDKEVWKRLHEVGASASVAAEEDIPADHGMDNNDTTKSVEEQSTEI
ncbi:uncharacterized protein PODANS_3_1015 [Podospora anserina S mat+]|uniref:Podospora anserina S mat+ genomic DNA chromosome 3, supercontig 1 n=1 Tax=Podospora anserina (strain S / ATCC MYA-4624 / DSM 980 / FGSC 10383) TaxID=515849 RepID=B2ACH3_PODAN|nr:uncharacterized protein PODANS_3_1015 [Podospora anserina S mat+]CAP61138.1 unnamed protein product [Podospora anserina S mat+]CDP26587.1 Putative protein of unknown function [Podospora anserina S mat+]